MQRTIVSQRFFSPPDLLILFLLGTVIYSLAAVGYEYRAEFHPVTHIDLSAWALPRYTLMSAVRGSVAYLISLGFTLIVGYVAAKSRQAERILIPMLDILQSVPVLGFLPGLTMALIALFPHTNMGLELVAVIMIFTGQVWNMTFSYYSSLKSLPTDLTEASTVMGLSRGQKLLNLELPFSAVNLAWNSLMSMAGGWFFLTICEAFKIGDREFRLPGIGAYMAVAVANGDQQAMVLGVLAMVALIVSMDFLIWRPILSWVRRFRLEEVAGAPAPEPLMRLLLRESRILRWLKVEVRRYDFRHRYKRAAAAAVPLLVETKWTPVATLRMTWNHLSSQTHSPKFLKGVHILLGALALGGVLWGVSRLSLMLWVVPLQIWVMVLRNALWTLARVLIALLISTLWAVPVGIWIGTSARRTRIAQPVVQVLASFPAPMLYPIAIGVFLGLGINFEWGSMFLMLLGVQWYVLFNVLAGALRVPQELRYALDLMEISRWDRWKVLYLPSVFPALVTGWVTATGGAWNASIAAEYISYKGSNLIATGLGATMFAATDRGDMQLLAASLTVMVLIVLIFNRAVWARVYAVAQSRFRMDT